MGGLGAPSGASMGDTSCQVRGAPKPLASPLVGRSTRPRTGLVGRDMALVLAPPRELERLPDQALDGRLLSVGRTAQGDVTRVLAGALEQPAFVLALPAPFAHQSPLI